MKEPCFRCKRPTYFNDKVSIDLWYFKLRNSKSTQLIKQTIFAQDSQLDLDIDYANLGTRSWLGGNREFEKWKEFDEKILWYQQS